MTTGLAALFAIAAIAATYYTCVRPMRRHGHGEGGGTAQDAETDRQVAVLREELRVLRAQDSLNRGRASDA